MSATRLTADLFPTDVPPAPSIRRRKKGEDKLRPVDVLAFQFEQARFPRFVRELMFAKAIGRRWRFDFAFLDWKVAVEVEGLVVMRKWIADLNGPPIVRGDHVVNVKSVSHELVVLGRHASITGFKDDAEKYAHAAVYHWYVLRFEQSQVKSGFACEMTERVLNSRGWHR